MNKSKITLCIFMIGVFSFASFSFAGQSYSLLESGSSLAQTWIEEMQDGQTATGEAVVLNSWDQEITSWTVELKSKKSIEEVEYMLRQRERGFSIMSLVTTILWIIMWLGLWLVWISMLIHAIKHAQKNKTFWILVIIFWNVVWALLYYFIGKKETTKSKQNKYEHHKMPKNYHNPKNN